MRLKRYTHGLTLFISQEMFQALKRLSDSQQVSMSELVREVLQSHILKIFLADGNEARVESK